MVLRNHEPIPGTIIQPVSLRDSVAARVRKKERDYVVLPPRVGSLCSRLGADSLCLDVSSSALSQQPVVTSELKIADTPAADLNTGKSLANSFPSTIVSRY